MADLTPRAFVAAPSRPGCPHVHVAAYRALVPNPFALDYLVELSMRTLGFFTDHAPRAWEYPVVLERALATSGLVIDLGAGLSPLPFALAERGREVLTVDNSPIIRDPDDRHAWSEWGSLDYGVIDPRIASRRTDMTQLELSPGSVGCFVSVSVVEHMPATQRRALWPRLRRALSFEGALVLTLDLEPGCEVLWNRCLGQTVDAEGHGTLWDVLGEMRAARLAVGELSFARGLPGSQTDIACLTARPG
ncbi:methyltransferase domain-containing protein [Acuticoccus sp.]|uniref:methyltransferase domain-containing protein n=1 Tax=Acuticoccus sp. TaxID=1904378 RepID=UPI003B517F01